MPVREDPSPPPRVEWQVQVNILHVGWEDYGDGFDSREKAERFRGELWTSRLVRRVWRLESEEVVDG